MCTALALKTADFYFGRNLDLEYHYVEQVVITPRKYVFSFLHEQKKEEHYALIGMAYVNENYPLYYDACNEKGLCMASLSMPIYTCYKTYQFDKHNVAPFELIPYLLSQCESVEAVKEVMKDVNIVAESFRDTLPLTPLHFMVSDKKESIVIECLQDGMHIYENNVGVLCNNPPFPMMLFQLNHYMQLTSKMPMNQFSEDIDFKVYSNGLGAFALPGDNSSVSRFVRCVFHKYNAFIKNSEEDSVVQFFHILDSVKQIKGSVICKDGKYEKTIYTSCINANTQTYYYKTYENSAISMVCMNNENLDSNKLICYPLLLKNSVYIQNKKDKYCIK